MHKQKAYRNRTLLDMARGRECLLRIPGVCNYNPETTVACHSNQSKHGKGAGLKASDQFSVWGCSDCHRALDQGNASREAKTLAFDVAHVRQVAQWVYIVKHSNESARFKKAAQEALDQLGMGEWYE